MNTYECTVAHVARPDLATRQFRIDAETLPAAARVALALPADEVLIGVRAIRFSVERKAA